MYEFILSQICIDTILNLICYYRFFHVSHSLYRTKSNAIQKGNHPKWNAVPKGMLFQKEYRSKRNAV